MLPSTNEDAKHASASVVQVLLQKMDVGSELSADSPTLIFLVEVG